MVNFFLKFSLESKDGKLLHNGVHCLECSLKSGLIGGKKITGLDLRLPEDSSFEKMDFNQDLREKTASVEGKSQK